MRYQEGKKLELYIKQEFEISDIKKITDEVLGNEKVMLQKVEVYEDIVSIVANEITDEQKSSIIEKVNEKYGTEIKAEDTEITTIPHTRGRDIVRPYIIPFIIATAIILAYMLIKYRKLGISKTFLKVSLSLIIAQLVLASIMAIARIPIGRLTIPLVLTVYVLTLVGVTSYLEKQNIKEDEEGI